MGVEEEARRRTPTYLPWSRLDAHLTDAKRCAGAKLLRRRTPVDNTKIVSADDLIVSLLKDPTSEEHAIAEGVGLHDGAHVPFRMFAKLAVTTRRHANWIGSMDGLMKKARRHALGALVALAVNLAAFGGFLLHRAREDGAAGERAVQVEQRNQERQHALEREIQDLRLDVRELRAAMRRMSGADPEHPSSDTNYEPDPDRLSAIGQWSSVLASGVPAPVAQPRSSCGATCSSSIECSFGVLKPCPFCNFGTCKSTRPEEPIPVDAGVDAPPGGAQP